MSINKRVKRLEERFSSKAQEVKLSRFAGMSQSDIEYWLNKLPDPDDDPEDYIEYEFLDDDE